MMRKATQQRAMVMIAACVLASGAVSAAPLPDTSAPLPIRIGYQPNPDWLLFVAREERLFEKAGLAPTYIKFAAETPMIAAAQNKTIDVASIGSVPFLYGLAQGLDWTMIGINQEGAYTEGVAVGKDSGILMLADLKGKRIGYQKGSTAHYGLIMILRQLGIRLDQVTLIDMRPAEQVAAIASGQLDAATTWEPWLQKMVHEAHARILTTEGDMGIYTHVDGYAAQHDWLLNNRETAVRFVRTLSMAYDILQKNPAAVNRVLAEELQIEQPWVEGIYRNAPPPRINLWADRRYRYSLVPEAAFHWRLKYLASFLHAEGFTPVEVSVDNALDPSIVAEALSLPSPETLAVESERTPEPAASTGPAAVFAADRTQIVVFTWWATGRESAAIQALIDMFNAAQSGAEVVNVAYADMTRAKQAIRQRILGGDPPDTFQVFMGHELIDSWVKPGYMEPLDELYAASNLRQVLPESMLEMISYDGHVWAIPANIHRANVLWYSRAAFREAGIPKAPATWSEFFVAADKLKAAGITPLALGSKETWPAVNLFEAVLLGTLGPERYCGLWTGQTPWNTTEVTEALETFRRALSLANDNHSTLTWNRAAGLLMDGRAAMYIMNDSIQREFLVNDFTDYGWANSPGTIGVYDALSDTFGLPKGTKHPDLTLQFLGLLSSREGQEAFNKLKGSICARTDCDYTGFSDYQKESAADWRRDIIVQSVVYGGAAGEKWSAAFFNAIVEFMASRDVDQTQQALIQAAADALQVQD